MIAMRVVTPASLLLALRLRRQAEDNEAKRAKQQQQAVAIQIDPDRLEHPDDAQQDKAIRTRSTAVGFLRHRRFLCCLGDGAFLFQLFFARRAKNN
jgi:hypothetical protein